MANGRSNREEASRNAVNTYADRGLCVPWFTNAVVSVGISHDDRHGGAG